MKSLYLLRHAKSSWAIPGLGDRDRTLNDRGREQCIVLADWFTRTGFQADTVLCSTSERTRETLSRLGTSYHGGETAPETHFLDELYESPLESYLSTLWAQQSDTLLLIGHNPTCDELTRYLASPSSPAADRLMARHFGTANIAVLEFAGENWSDLGASSCQLTTFASPKQIEKL